MNKPKWHSVYMNKPKWHSVVMIKFKLSEFTCLIEVRYVCGR